MTPMLLKAKESQMSTKELHVEVLGGLVTYDRYETGVSTPPPLPKPRTPKRVFVHNPTPEQVLDAYKKRLPDCPDVYTNLVCLMTGFLTHSVPNPLKRVRLYLVAFCETVDEGIEGEYCDMIHPYWGDQKTIPNLYEGMDQHTLKKIKKVYKKSLNSVNYKHNSSLFRHLTEAFALTVCIPS